MGQRKNSGFIYTITNTVNGKKYVGKTASNDPQRRWREHRDSARLGKDKVLYHAIRKYGVGNFTFEVLKQTSTLNEDEVATIRSLNSHISTGQGYNVTWGGDGGDTRYIPIDQDWLRSKLKDGVTLAKIAMELGVTYETVSLRVREFWGMTPSQLRRQLGTRIPQGKQIDIAEVQLRQELLANQKMSTVYKNLGVGRKGVEHAMQRFWGTKSVRELRDRWGLNRTLPRPLSQVGEHNGMWGRKHRPESKILMAETKSKNKLAAKLQNTELSQ